MPLLLEAALMVALAVGPPRVEIEVGPPSWGFPVYFRRQVKRPAPIPGYLWGEHDYGMQSKFGFPDPGWALYRTNSSPPNNRELYRRLGVPPEELFFGGRAEDCPEGWAPR